MMLVLVLGAIIALFVDFALGDPKNKFHPTAWIGNLIGKLVPFFQNSNQTVEKINGLILTLSISALIVSIFYSVNVILHYLELADFNLLARIATLIFSVMVVGFLLKTTMAITGLEKHSKLIMEALSKGNLDDARAKLSMIVKRDTKNLDRQHIISGTLESISENTVDGITGPLFYFAIFGLPGAFIYRTINTIDSMIGYKTDLFKNLGWFGANCDKVLNFLPSRITSLVMILAIMILKENWKHSIEIMRRDCKKTESPNAGYPMATLAGALSVKFEKIDHYVLGDGNLELNESHFKSAISIMKLTAILFCIIFTIPMIIVLSYLGWWLYV